MSLDTTSGMIAVGIFDGGIWDKTSWNPIVVLRGDVVGAAIISRRASAASSTITFSVLADLSAWISFSVSTAIRVSPSRIFSVVVFCDWSIFYSVSFSIRLFNFLSNVSPEIFSSSPWAFCAGSGSGSASILIAFFFIGRQLRLSCDLSKPSFVHSHQGAEAYCLSGSEKHDWEWNDCLHSF